MNTRWLPIRIYNYPRAWVISYGSVYIGGQFVCCRNLCIVKKWFGMARRKKKTIKVGKIKISPLDVSIGHQAHQSGSGPHKHKADKRNSRANSKRKAINEQLDCPTQTKNAAAPNDIVRE